VNSTSLLSACIFPDLPAPYHQALQDAVRFILTYTDPVGIIAAGTILRGSPDPSSDLDLYVIHLLPWRQRLQKFFQGVPAEIFINPPFQIERYLVEECSEGRPITAHMLATGHIILAIDPVVHSLHERAVQLLAAPPEYPPERLTFLRYGTATILEDALDVAIRDPATASLFLGNAVSEMLRYFFLASHRYLPRNKDILRTVDELSPELGSLARQFFLVVEYPERQRLAEAIADRTIGVHGFFEWEGIPETLEGS